MNHRYAKWRCLLGVISLALLAGSARAEIAIHSGAVQMTPPSIAGFHSMEARIVGAAGTVFHQTSSGESLVWSCGGCADGAYGVETRTAVQVGEAQTDEGPRPELRVAQTESARFRVQGGTLVPMENLEPAKDGQSWNEEAAPLWQRAIEGVLDWLVPTAHAADLTASSTVPVVYFDDTTSSYVGNEFLLLCQGGAGGTDTDNYCYMRDAENTQYMWYAISNPGAQYLGLGTSAPTTSLHIATPQTPQILLDSTSTDFQIGGSDDIQFQLINNNFGPTGTVLTIENDLSGSLYPGVGIWQSNPSAPLEVGSEDSMSAKLIVENTAAPVAAGDVAMFQLTNPGPKIVRFQIAAGTSTWTFDNDPAFGFRISKLGTGVAEFTVDPVGTGRFVGNSYAVNHINTSSRTVKAGFAPVDAKEVLDRVAALPITTWHYQTESPDAVHMGPVAEDFQEQFGLGDGQHISTVDEGGVALAAIQGLYRLLEEKDAQIEALREQNRELRQDSGGLAARLEALEAKAGIRPVSY